MKFKQLHIGQAFEFDHSKLPIDSGIKQGRWIKVSARKYRKATTLGTSWHGQFVNMHCEVGSINTTVKPIHFDHITGAVS